MCLGVGLGGAEGARAGSRLLRPAARPRNDTEGKQVRGRVRDCFGPLRGPRNDMEGARGVRADWGLKVPR